MGPAETHPKGSKPGAACRSTFMPARHVTCTFALYPALGWTPHSVHMEVVHLSEDQTGDASQAVRRFVESLESARRSLALARRRSCFAEGPLGCLRSLRVRAQALYLCHYQVPDEHTSAIWGAHE